MTTTRPTFEGVKQAAERLKPHMTPTPLFRSETLSRALDADVWLKVETATPIASFKLRGALNHLLVAQSQAPVKSAVTSSTGNHGQGVAYAARLLGVAADIFLPEGCPVVKQTMIKLFGGTLHVAISAGGSIHNDRKFGRLRIIRTRFDQSLDNARGFVRLPGGKIRLHVAFSGSVQHAVDRVFRCRLDWPSCSKRPAVFLDQRSAQRSGQY